MDSSDSGHIRERTHEPWHERTHIGCAVANVIGPIIVRCTYVSLVLIFIVIDSVCGCLFLTPNLRNLAEIVVVDLSVVYHIEVDSVRNVVPDHRILESGCSIGTISGVGVVAYVEGDCICGIRSSLIRNDLVDVRKRGGRNLVKRVGAYPVGDERDVRRGELAVVEGSVESHHGHSAVGADGIPVAVRVTVDGEVGFIIDLVNQSVVGVDVGVSVAAGLILVGEILTGQFSLVVRVGSPLEVESAVRNRLSGIIAVSGIGHPSIDAGRGLLVRPEFNLGSGRWC